MILMKVGLITFHYAHHYGAQLQAYALQKAIEKLGHSCEIIDYVRPDTIEGSSLFKKGASPSAMMSNIHTLLHLKSFRRRHRRFCRFVEEQMKLGPKRYASLGELMEDPPEYDCYICGSDQVWNPFIFRPEGLDPAFFMPFAGGKKRIAYAPSFGIESMPEPYAESLREYLSGFSALSARETSGSQIIRSLTGRDAEVVLDPTMLLGEDDWLGVCSESHNKNPYILCYFVSDPAPFTGTIQNIAEKLNLPVITLCGSRKPIPGSKKRVFDAGPREFLSLIRDASFVCTNSFHGMVFSIIFRRDFYCFERSAASNRSVNSRLHSLLAKLELTDRILSAEINDMGNLGSRIDYARVLDRLEKERERSLDYLKRALE